MPECDSPTCQLAAGMTDDQRMLTEHRAAVRANLATDTPYAAYTVRHAIDQATCASVPVPAEVVDAAAAVERWRAWSASSSPPSGPSGPPAARPCWVSRSPPSGPWHAAI
jgi:hypothetical protein